jgi:hypothetical protein
MVPIAITPVFFSYVISSSSLNCSLKKSNATDSYVTHVLTRVALWVTWILVLTSLDTEKSTAEEY